MRAWAVVLLCLAGSAAALPHQRAIVGVWRGTSSCVDRTLHPACVDETVVYEFRPLPDDRGAVRLEAKKVVGGRAETMYLLDFTYDPERKVWASEFRAPHAHGEWSYAVEGDALRGRLLDLPSRALVRTVTAMRDASSTPAPSPAPPSEPPSSPPPGRRGS
jgi:hypothetical protein